MLGVVKHNHHGGEETRRYNPHCSLLSSEHAELLYQKCVGSSTTVNGSAKLTPASAQSFIISLIHLECVGPNSVITLVWLQSEGPCCRALPTHCSLKTVSSIDVYLNLDDCILHYSPMYSLNFVHIVHIVRLILHFILCNWFRLITALNIVTARAWHAWLKGYLSYLIFTAVSQTTSHHIPNCQ